MNVPRWCERRTRIRTVATPLSFAARCGFGLTPRALGSLHVSGAAVTGPRLERREVFRSDGIQVSQTTIRAYKCFSTADAILRRPPKVTGLTGPAPRA